MANKGRDCLWTIKSLDVKCNYRPFGQMCGGDDEVNRYCCWICVRLGKCVTKWKSGSIFCPRSGQHHWCSAAMDHYLGES